MSKSLVIGQEDIVIPWVMEKTKSACDERSSKAIGLAKDGELVAGVVYTEYNKVNVTGITAGEGKYWLNREFLWFVFYYPFFQLGCKRVTGLIAASNKESIRFHEHLGFVLEATLKDAHPTGDLLVYVMWPENCRWLSLYEEPLNGQENRNSSNT